MNESKCRKQAADVITAVHEVYGKIKFEMVHTLDDGRCVYLSERTIDNLEMSAKAPDHEYGVDVYGLTDIHQWLNSDKANWWTEKVEGAKEPSYTYKAGFLAGFEPEFVSRLQDVDVLCAGRDRKPYTVRAKFFVPSYTELTGESTCGVMEGVWWDKFREATETRGYGGMMDALKKKEARGKVYDWWWQRSCHPWSPDRFRFVNRDGNPYNYVIACYPFRGLAVACVI